MSNKYGQKLADTGKKSATDGIKTASKRAIQKTAEVTGELVGNKIADKITSALKKNHVIKNDHQLRSIKKCRKKYVSPKKSNNILMN